MNSSSIFSLLIAAAVAAFAHYFPPLHGAGAAFTAIFAAVMLPVTLLYEKKKIRQKILGVPTPYASLATLIILAGLGGGYYFWSLPPKPKSVEEIVVNSKIPWLSAAIFEVGQRELFGETINPRVAEYFAAVGNADGFQDDKKDWASAFVEWSLNQAGISGPKNHDPLAWRQWGQKTDLKMGCIAIFDFKPLKHVGFYIDEHEGGLRVLGGNQAGSVVNVWQYNPDSLLECRLPSIVTSTSK